MKSVVLAALCLALAAPSYAQAIDISGRWDVSVVTPQGGAQAVRRAAPQQPPAREKPVEAKVDLTGAWALRVNTMGGTGTPTVTLEQEGQKLSGRYVGGYGEAEVTGSVKGNEFTFSFMMAQEGSPVAVIYTGVVEKDTMKGTVSLGETGDGTFTGKKK